MENESSFHWDPLKEKHNIIKHGVDFRPAAEAFRDPKRRIMVDSLHSKDEERYFCLGKVNGRVLTIRFIYRNGKIRIFGAGHWRKGTKEYYAKEN